MSVSISPAVLNPRMALHSIIVILLTASDFVTDNRYKTEQTTESASEDCLSGIFEVILYKVLVGTAEIWTTLVIISLVPVESRTQHLLDTGLRCYTLVRYIFLCGVIWSHFAD